ncbi:hypothetical protein GCM10022222_22810 [Amycolatopsis ultiminotia]|uniref:Uncharacterized protein n=1 Tax=Amycolatopsis ultiminotia TaxID=543629 RepID=A0ABP6VPS7_9PSEU
MVVVEHGVEHPQWRHQQRRDKQSLVKLDTVPGRCPQPDHGERAGQARHAHRVACADGCRYR